MNPTSYTFFLYSEVLAPAPPHWLLEQAHALKESENTQATMNNWGEEFTARPLYKDGQIYKNAFNHSVFLDQTCLDWASANVSSAAKDIRITATRPGLDRCGAHIDRTRNYTLMYLLEPGSDHHETVFYKERGITELIRPKEYHVDNYDQLEIIKKIKLKVNSWNLIHARILHSVENITDGRTSIQISLDTLSTDMTLTNTVWHNV